jgi:hypothetical protein
VFFVVRIVVSVNVSSLSRRETLCPGKLLVVYRKNTYKAQNASSRFCGRLHTGTAQNGVSLSIQFVCTSEPVNCFLEKAMYRS